MTRRNVCVYIILLSTLSCSKNSTKLFSKREIQESRIDSSLIRNGNFLISYNDQSSSDSITIKYLGSGGYFFSNGEAAFLIDPFFSPIGMFPLNLKKIETQTDNVALGLNDIKSNLYDHVESIFVTHSHYDHLMDVPYVFNHYLDTTNEKAKIYGSSSMKTLIAPVVNSDRIVDLESYCGTSESKGNWIYLNGGSIRVMPIATIHAPHLKKGVSIGLYGGEGETIENYHSDVSPTRVTDWKVGRTYAYLIDFMRNKHPEFRIYLLSSASSPPNGFINQDLLKEHPINLAILGAASFDNVENYPQGILEYLKPEKLLIAHWEDLFKPYLHEPPRLIRASNFKKLIPDIDQVYPWELHGEQQFFMPAPGVFIYALY